MILTKLSGRLLVRLAELGSTFDADLPLVCDFLASNTVRIRLPGSIRRRSHARLLDIVRHMIRQRGTLASVHHH